MTDSSEGGSVLTNYMLTTVDNPWDPWTQWDQWYMWDLNAGYNTPGLLARLSYVSDELSEADPKDLASSPPTPLPPTQAQGKGGWAADRRSKRFVELVRSYLFHRK